MLRTNRPDSRIVVTQLSARQESKARAHVMKSLRPYKNPAFGLPYMKTAPGHARVMGAGVRHASPLWIHIQRCENGYVATYTLMRSASIQQ